MYYNIALEQCTLLPYSTSLEQFSVLHCVLIKVENHTFFGVPKTTLAAKKNKNLRQLQTNKRNIPNKAKGWFVACPITLNIGDQSNSALWGYCCPKTKSWVSLTGRSGIKEKFSLKKLKSWVWLASRSRIWENCCQTILLVSYISTRKTCKIYMYSHFA